MSSSVDIRAGYPATYHDSASAVARRRATGRALVGGVSTLVCPVLGGFLIGNAVVNADTASFEQQKAAQATMFSK